jgi:thiol-disulfide isomerase/thioredoxin
MKQFYPAFSLAFLCSATAFAQGPSSDIAPNFILPDIDGVEHNMYAQLDQGKVVILDFWASWCQPCFESFPAMESIWNTHGPQGDNSVMIYALEMDNTTWFEHEVRDDLGIPYPVFDNGHLLHPDWNLEGYPTFAIICPDRSWHLLFTNLAGNPAPVLAYVNACDPPSSIQHDARPIDYVGAQDLCQQNEFVPVIRIQNRGADVMTSANIEVHANGTLQYTYPWTGALAQYYVSDSIFMPAIPGLGPSVDAQFIITQVNGALDNNPSDNELDVSIGQSLPGIAVSLELRTNDVTWSVAYALYDGAGTLIDTSDVPMNAQVTHNWTLEAGTCYRFLITNYLGEGMGNGGYYKLRDSQSTIFAQGGQFGSSAEHTFFVDGLNGIAEGIGHRPLSMYPDPSEGSVTLQGADPGGISAVEVFDAVGKRVLRVRVNAGQPLIDLSVLNDGLYHVHAIFRDGSDAVGRVVLKR